MKFNLKSILSRNFLRYRWFLALSYVIDELSKFHSISTLWRNFTHDLLLVDVDMFTFHSNRLIAEVLLKIEKSLKYDSKSMLWRSFTQTDYKFEWYIDNLLVRIFKISINRWSRYPVDKLSNFTQFERKKKWIESCKFFKEFFLFLYLIWNVYEKKISQFSFLP